MIEKICPKCKISKSIDRYGKDNDKKDGLYYCCKDCRRIDSRKRYELNRERILLTNKIWKENHRDKWYESGRNWKINHIDKFRALVRLQQHKRNGIKHNFTTKDWIDLRNSTNGMCPICKKYVGIDNLTIDHKIPISKVPKGFIYSITDIQPLCRSCNSSKGNKIIDSWICCQQNGGGYEWDLLTRSST